MVDISSMAEINALYAEKRRIEQAIQNFNAGGNIIELTVGLPGEAEPGGVTVSVAGLNYPPQMVDQIKQGLAGRLAAIDQRLNILGMTGIEEAAPQPGRVAAAPRPAAPVRPARPAVPPRPAAPPPTPPAPPPRVPPRPGRPMPRR